MFDHTVSCTENVFCRAIILLESKHFVIGIILFEIEDVPDVCAAKGVDALRVVPDDTDIPVLSRYQLDENVLGTIRVLEFIDENVTKTLLVFFEYFGLLLKQVDGVEEQVVEIHRIAHLEKLLVLLVHLHSLLLEKVVRQTFVFLG